MALLEQVKSTQKIVEIMLFGPTKIQNDFINKICKDAVKINENISFGRLEMGYDRYIYLYGLSVDNNNIRDFSFDLIARKMAGYVVLFDWNDKNGLRNAKILSDYVYFTFGARGLFAGDFGDNAVPPQKYEIQEQLPSSLEDDFTFYSQQDTDSCHKVIDDAVHKFVERIELV